MPESGGSYGNLSTAKFEQVLAALTGQSELTLRDLVKNAEWIKVDGTEKSSEPADSFGYYRYDGVWFYTLTQDPAGVRKQMGDQLDGFRTTLNSTQNGAWIVGGVDTQSLVKVRNSFEWLTTWLNTHAAAFEAKHKELTSENKDFKGKAAHVIGGLIGQDALYLRDLHEQITTAPTPGALIVNLHNAIMGVRNALTTAFNTFQSDPASDPMRLAMAARESVYKYLQTSGVIQPMSKSTSGDAVWTDDEIRAVLAGYSGSVTIDGMTGSFSGGLQTSAPWSQMNAWVSQQWLNAYQKAFDSQAVKDSITALNTSYNDFNGKIMTLMEPNVPPPTPYTMDKPEGPGDGDGGPDDFNIKDYLDDIFGGGDGDGGPGAGPGDGGAGPGDGGAGPGDDEVVFTTDGPPGGGNGDINLDELGGGNGTNEGGDGSAGAGGPGSGSGVVIPGDLLGDQGASTGGPGNGDVDLGGGPAGDGGTGPGFVPAGFVPGLGGTGNSVGTSQNNPDGSTTLSDGTVVDDGEVTRPDGTVIDGGKTTLPDGTVVNDDGTVTLPDGTEIPTGTTTTLPDGTLVGGDGEVTLPDGTQVSSDGTTTLPDGTSVNDDGTITYPDGTVVNPDGTLAAGGEDDALSTFAAGDNARAFSPGNGDITIDDGPVGADDGALGAGDGLATTFGDGASVDEDGATLADNTFVSDDGQTTRPDGTVIDDGTVTRPDGTVINDDGSITRPDGSTVDAGQTTTLPDGTVVADDGTVTLPDGTVVGPDGSTTLPDGTVIPGDGSAALPDGTTVGEDGTVMLPDGTEIPLGGGSGSGGVGSSGGSGTGGPGGGIPGGSGDVSLGNGSSGTGQPQSTSLPSGGSGQGAATSTTAGMSAMGGGTPFFPPMMGGMGGMGGGLSGNNNRERERQTWLSEDEKVWGTDPKVGPSVIGRYDDEDSDYADIGAADSGDADTPLVGPVRRRDSRTAGQETSSQ